MLWGACWGFTGIVVLLSHLLAELFALIGIDFLKDLLSQKLAECADHRRGVRRGAGVVARP